ncbi:hypothetical protein DFJ74DRAFT_720310 [Hyaloraphidium curvatum]|nr:hypothetical protein DFJ74DRAFT_720310 [Hyaloraphidium curvatum]
MMSGAQTGRHRFDLRCLPSALRYAASALVPTRRDRSVGQPTCRRIVAARAGEPFAAPPGHPDNKPATGMRSLRAAPLALPALFAAALFAGASAAPLFARSCAECSFEAFCEFAYPGAPQGSVACVSEAADNLHAIYRRYATVVTFSYTGAAQSWTVPEGATQATFEVYGASGSNGATFGGTAGSLGLGASVTFSVGVTPGDTYQIMVGGQGTTSGGGYNGGGAGGTSGRAGAVGSGGGGASDVRSGSCASSLTCSLGDRFVVAGGGGGGASVSGNGGNGGEVGGDGTTSTGSAGTGGTASAGGTGGARANGGSTAGGAGALGTGGAGGFASCGCGGPGGGGGGYYGGGGGGLEGGGGGGSSLGPSGAVFSSGANTGNGRVVVSYT